MKQLRRFATLQLAVFGSMKKIFLAIKYHPHPPAPKNKKKKFSLWKCNEKHIFLFLDFLIFQTHI